MSWPSKPARQCLDCRKITTYGSRCPSCARTFQARHEQQRGTRTQRGYDNDWLRLVAQAIKRQPYCTVCGHEGSADNPLTGDHRIPLSRGGTSTAENVIVLCRYHNSQKGNRSYVARGTRTVETTKLAPVGEKRRERRG